MKSDDEDDRERYDSDNNHVSIFCIEMYEYSEGPVVDSDAPGVFY